MRAQKSRSPSDYSATSSHDGPTPTPQTRCPPPCCPQVRTAADARRRRRLWEGIPSTLVRLLLTASPTFTVCVRSLPHGDRSPFRCRLPGDVHLTESKDGPCGQDSAAPGAQPCRAGAHPSSSGRARRGQASSNDRRNVVASTYLAEAPGRTARRHRPRPKSSPEQDHPDAWRRGTFQLSARSARFRRAPPRRRVGTRPRHRWYSGRNEEAAPGWPPRMILKGTPTEMRQEHHTIARLRFRATCATSPRQFSPSL